MRVSNIYECIRNEFEQPKTTMLSIPVLVDLGRTLLDSRQIPRLPRVDRYDQVEYEYGDRQTLLRIVSSDDRWKVIKHVDDPTSRGKISRKGV